MTNSPHSLIEAEAERIVKEASYYFCLYGKDRKEYRIFRAADNSLIAGGFGNTKHATIAEAKRHLARLERGEPLADAA